MVSNFCLDWKIHHNFLVKFISSKKATKIDKIFTVDLTLCSKCQINGEDFVNFCGLLRKHELYQGNSAYRWHFQYQPTYLLTSPCQRSLRTPLNLHSEQALLNWILTWTTSYFRILQFFSSTSFALQLALGKLSTRMWF